MNLDRTSLMDRIGDTAEVLEGAERKVEYLCNDYGIFCPKNQFCKDTKLGCPAYKKGIKIL